MTHIQKAVNEYLAMRQGLGYKLKLHVPVLRKFSAFLKHEGAAHITTKLALQWVQRCVHGHPANAAQHLSVIRGFAQHWSATDPLTEVPPAGLLPFKHPRRTPYLYTQAEIQSLVEVASQLPPADGLKRWTYSTILGLLAATGLRVSEALHLYRDELDFNSGVLTIRMTKFKKSRLVPLHSTTVDALQQYAKRRDQLYPGLSVPHFFISIRGGPVSYGPLSVEFRRLSRQIGLCRPTDRFGPRIHDLRHSFAVATVMDWYRRGLNVEARLPFLSTYLGHTEVSDTYWYLSAVPDLLSLTAKRLQKRWEDL